MLASTNASTVIYAFFRIASSQETRKTQVATLPPRASKIAMLSIFNADTPSMATTKRKPKTMQKSIRTKFVNIAKAHYASKCRDIDIIKLNGSIELAPILGLSDVIVDIVETGTTLKENDLEVFETIVPISARFIANKSSFKFKTEQIEKIVESMRNQVKAND